MSIQTKEQIEAAEQKPFSELWSSGLLWLINTSVLHPRGYALVIHVDDEGQATGWSIAGDGSERWAFSEQRWPEGGHPDDRFLAIKELLP